MLGSPNSPNSFGFHSVAMNKYLYLMSVLLCCMQGCRSSDDMTSSAFGDVKNILPAAFGDFNSDESTDLFVIENERNVTILLASRDNKEPYFQRSDGLQCQLPAGYMATSVIPGDFDGDALMDFLVTAVSKEAKVIGVKTYVFINWGNTNSVNCSKKPDITMKDQPLVIDYDQDLVADLFGSVNDTTNAFWIFTKNNRSVPPKEVIVPNDANIAMRTPHSHAFVDMNNDNLPDLFLTTQTGFSTWTYDKDSKESEVKFKFDPNYQIPYPDELHPLENYRIGQNLFMDLETAGSLQVILPVCKTTSCTDSAIYVYANQRWVNLNVSFSDYSNDTWNFVAPDGRAYTDAITLRAADFNNDGYVDMLATLTKKGTFVEQTYLLENVACVGSCSLKRTFQIQWTAFRLLSQNTVMGAFYDFLQDGIMDVIFVKPVKSGESGHEYMVTAFRNSLDYDANFLKVMVISGLQSARSAANSAPSILGSKQPFGTSLAGPKAYYKTTNQDDEEQVGMAVQLPQSAYNALYLPYTIFGLGRIPNFIDELTVGVFNHTHKWSQIIPNSQMVVIPYPQDEPEHWKVLLFVTPSKIVLQTVAALLGTCVIIAFIIAVLHWKERREDRIEKLQEAHRFHFDAM